MNAVRTRDVMCARGKMGKKLTIPNEKC